MERFARFSLFVVAVALFTNVSCEVGTDFLSKVASNFSDAFKSGDGGEVKSIQSMREIKPVAAANSDESNTDENSPTELSSELASTPPSNVASLPPMPVIPSSQTSIPEVLLPSKMHVVTHQPVVAETNPRKRGQCHEILNHVEKSGMWKIRNTPAFGAFVHLIDLVSEERAVISRRGMLLTSACERACTVARCIV
eukprot:Lankesteria_metandrocarpae@DN3816_c0_g1_i2.p2